MSHVSIMLNALRREELYVNKSHDLQKDIALKKDLKEICKACRKLKDAVVRPLCSWDGVPYYGISSGDQKVLVPSAYALIAPVGVYSDTIRYRCFVAQGRMLDYLMELRRNLSQKGIGFAPIRHLYCATIMCGTESLESGTCELQDEETAAASSFMKNHLDIYKRRFADVLESWKAYTSTERIASGDCLGDFYRYYNEGFLDVLESKPSSEQKSAIA